MMLSEQWLREWTSPRLDSQALADRLTASGLEVASIESAGKALPKVVVGKIASLAPHPRSNKLKVCDVDVGRSRKLQIVCGAANAAEGMKSPVALIGAVLADGSKVTKTRIRDVVSSGMLCSAAELGLEQASDGIMPLDSNTAIGKPVSDVLGFDDNILDIELTPDRGDCLSVLGIAREVATACATRLRWPKLPKPDATIKTRLPIRIKAGRDCPRYIGRVVKGIDMSAPTPHWMSEKLRRSGVRSVNCVVDVTNYVMLELGQPMHAFDLNRLDTGIIVRHAEEGETLTLLDDTKVKMDAETLVIADQSKAIALAGIMGGAGSAINANTRDILFEAAHFRPQIIARKARQYRMHTDASHRFERGVDATLPETAIHRATELLLAIAGGEAGPVTEAKHDRHLPKQEPILLRHKQIERLLGMKLSTKRVEKTLTRLDMKLRQNKNGWRVTAPSHRFDISAEHDLIEEIARIDGYDTVPVKLPRIGAPPPAQSESVLSAQRVRTLMTDRDYREVITYSFIDSELQNTVDAKIKPVSLVNPIAENMAVMRTSLWPGLLHAVTTNFNRQHRRIRLFELGHVFFHAKDGYREEQRLAGVVSGEALPEQWGIESAPVDFFDIKGDLESLLKLSGRQENFIFESVEHAALHSGQTAAIKLGKQRVGTIGCLHPRLQLQLDIDQPVYLFEINYDAVAIRDVPAYVAISRFPAVRRDISLLVKEQVSAKNLFDTITAAGGKALTQLHLFSIYRGESIDASRKSVSFRLTFQESSRTLMDMEVERIMKRILKTLRTKHEAELRE